MTRIQARSLHPIPLLRGEGANIVMLMQTPRNMAEISHWLFSLILLGVVRLRIPPSEVRRTNEP